MTDKAKQSGRAGVIDLGETALKQIAGGGLLSSPLGVLTTKKKFTTHDGFSFAIEREMKETGE